MPNTCYDLKGRSEYVLGRTIKREVKEFNLAEEDGDTFRAAVIFIFMARSGIRKTFLISRRLHYVDSFVRMVVRNLIQYEYLKDGQLYMNITDNYASDMIELTLMALLVTGKIVRVKE